MILRIQIAVILTVEYSRVSGYGYIRLAVIVLHISIFQQLLQFEATVRV